jgi:hypothetical protein
MIGKRGKFTGNGAALNISVGFKPDFVLIINVTDGTSVEFFIDDVAGATGSVDIDAAAGPVTDAGGITAFAGDSSNAPGFSVDAGNSVNAKVYRYIALGNLSE